MTERLVKTVIIQLPTDTWLRDYYYKCYKQNGESRKQFDTRVYALGLQNLKEAQK